MSNGFTAEQIAFIRQVAFEMLPTIERQRREDLAHHIADCRHGARLSRILWIALGVGVSSGIVSAGGALALLKAVFSP